MLTDLQIKITPHCQSSPPPLWKIQRNISQCASRYLLAHGKQKWVFMEYTISHDPHPQFADSIFTPQNVDFCVSTSQRASMCQLRQEKQKWVIIQYEYGPVNTWESKHGSSWGILFLMTPHPKFTDSTFTPQNVDFCMGRSQRASMYRYHVRSKSGLSQCHNAQVCKKRGKPNTSDQKWMKVKPLPVTKNER